ncbi:MAG: hypothetical protein JNL74_03200, partial [Fibrobacteres bacterium]|nr:hypothetical protein [Fibrobacterota bacterium]
MNMKKACNSVILLLTAFVCLVKINAAELYEIKNGGALFMEPVGAYISMKWHTPDGIYEGFGKQDGNGIYAAWGPAAWYGLIVYEIEQDGSISGVSAKRESSDALITGQMEKLRLVKRPEGETDQFCGKFSITGITYSESHNTGQISYSGILNVSKQNDIYNLKWTAVGKEGAKFFGVGLRRGNKLGVAWGGDNDNYGIVDYRTSDKNPKSLIGRYINFSHAKIDTEIITKIESSGNRESLLNEFQKYKPKAIDQPWSSVPA